jgi:hypothetical protein
MCISYALTTAVGDVAAAQGAGLLFDRYLVPHLSRYERKLDTLLEAGAQLAVSVGGGGRNAATGVGVWVVGCGWWCPEAEPSWRGMHQGL